MPLSPSHYAQEIRHKHNLSGPLDPLLLTNKFNIKVFEEPIDADGYLITQGDDARILVNRDNPYESRKRFTVAHEIGHYYMPHHQDQIFRCLAQDIQSFKSTKILETEANQFASELLLPSIEVRSLLKYATNLEGITHVSDLYGTSLTSTAVRLAEFSSERVAVVLSELGRVKWFAKSKSWPYWFRRGPLHEWTYAYDYFNKGILPEIPRKVLLRSWCDGCGINDEATEESLAFARLGLVLTLLHVPLNADLVEDIDY